MKNGADIFLNLITDCLHLQLYGDSKDRYKQGQTKASLSLQHFLGVESGFTLDKESNTIAIICQDLTVVLAFDTRERLIQWQVKISNNLGEGIKIKNSLALHVTKKFQVATYLHVFLFHCRSTIFNFDIECSGKSKIIERAGAFARTGPSFLHNSRCATKTGRHLGDWTFATLRSGRGTLLFRGWFALRSWRRTARFDNGPGGRYRENVAISSRRKIDNEKEAGKFS